MPSKKFVALWIFSVPLSKVSTLMAETAWQATCQLHWCHSTQSNIST